MDGVPRVKNRAFTLIELLVVIAIIGILAGVVLANTSSARTKATDIRAVADFKSVKTAMFMYQLKYGTAPQYTNASPCCTPALDPGHTLKFQNMAQDLVNEGFLTNIPTPPSGYFYQYYYYGGNTIGGLMVVSLKGIDATAEPPYNSCRPFFPTNWCNSNPSTPSTYYCVCNP
jgi:prepilin-type N-terminal cleavage/methylation domain-containing protein